MADEGVVPAVAPESVIESTAEPVVTGLQNSEVEAPSATPEVKPATPEKAPEKPGQSRFERRIDKATREAATQRARADLYERQLAELKPKEQPKAAPDPAAFTDINEYTKAVEAHAEANAISKFQQGEQQKAAQAAHQQLVSSWETRVAQAEAKYPDFDQVVGDLQPTTPWAAALMRAENGADVAHHLGTNLSEAKRIGSLDPISQILEIGRLAAKLSMAPVEPKKPTEAPEPIKPVGNSGSSAPKKLIDIESQDEFEKRRKKQIAARH